MTTVVLMIWRSFIKVSWHIGVGVIVPLACPVTVNDTILLHWGPTPLPVKAIQVAVYVPRGSSDHVVHVYWLAEVNTWYEVSEFIHDQISKIYHVLCCPLQVREIVSPVAIVPVFASKDSHRVAPLVIDAVHIQDHVRLGR